ncbi:MAG: D-alanyl-D-alanine carboxypeptidase/D-alanyl-D-alanine-endopeptidase [Phycisphaerales bacterium]|nr:D-alanyl-D-alanine carboxypeptidase/D-alanyl-D-alanine-endopeptidase [Phycisphaerales bacterium]
MKTSRIPLLLAILWTCASAIADTDFSEVRKRVDRVLAGAPKAHVCLVVRGLSDGQTWIDRDGDEPAKPASVLKLFTTAAALERFGVDFAFETSFLLSPVTSADGGQTRELWVIGGGDPGLADERLLEREGATVNDWLAKFAARVKAHLGDARLSAIVLDDDVFDREWRNDTWPPDQVDRWYQAPAGGVNFNDNCVDFAVELNDGNPRAVTTPPMPDTFLRVNLKRGKDNTAIVARLLESDVFDVRGDVKSDHVIGPASVRDPTLFAGYALRQALQQAGAPCPRVLRRDFAANQLAGADEVLKVRTPLRDIIWRCNTFSQNLFAEALMKSLNAYGRGGAPTGQPGSWSTGISILRSTLEGIGVELNGAEFRDGSGLSHHNRVSASQIVTLLHRAQTRPWGAVFRDSLAEPGEEGSLERRYDDDRLKGRVWAKTGTIRGVRSLAGYLERPDGQRLVFAIMVNGSGPRDLPERVLLALLD